MKTESGLPEIKYTREEAGCIRSDYKNLGIIKELNTQPIMEFINN
jgi:hypothetical protein